MHQARLSGLPARHRDPLGTGEILDIKWVVADTATRFASAKVRHLHGWWRAADGGRMPLRRAFDVTEHAWLTPNLFLVEVRPDGRFRFKVQGEDVIAMLGVNTTGRIVSRDPLELYDCALDRYYRSIVADPRCRTCTGNLAAYDRAFIRFESIDCPLTDDGATVSAIVGVLDRLPGRPPSG